MKKIVLFLSVISIASSLMAVDIFTRNPGKKTKTPAQTETTNASALTRPADTVCAVTGVPIKISDSTPFSKYSGDNYYFISNNEKEQFDSNPFKFAKDIETCSVCGKQEKKTRGKSSFLELNSSGKVYHFCTLLHSEEFEKEPVKYMKVSGSSSTKQTIKKKAPAADKKKESSEDVEILAEDTPIVKTPAPVTAPAPVPAPAQVITPEKKETKQTEKTLIIDIEKKVPEVKQTVPVPPAVNKVPAEKVKAPKKEVTMEFEDTIIEE